MCSRATSQTRSIEKISERGENNSVAIEDAKRGTEAGRSADQSIFTDSTLLPRIIVIIIIIIISRPTTGESFFAGERSRGRRNEKERSELGALSAAD